MMSGDSPFYTTTVSVCPGLISITIFSRTSPVDSYRLDPGLELLSSGPGELLGRISVIELISLSVVFAVIWFDSLILPE